MPGGVDPSGVRRQGKEMGAMEGLMEAEAASGNPRKSWSVSSLEIGSRKTKCGSSSP